MRLRSTLKPSYSYRDNKKIDEKSRTSVLLFALFARHGRALTGVSPEHAQVVGNV